MYSSMETDFVLNDKSGRIARYTYTIFGLIHGESITLKTESSDTSQIKPTFWL